MTYRLTAKKGEWGTDLWIAPVDFQTAFDSIEHSSNWSTHKHQSIRRPLDLTAVLLGGSVRDPVRKNSWNSDAQNFGSTRSAWKRLALTTSIRILAGRRPDRWYLAPLELIGDRPDFSRCMHVLSHCQKSLTCSPSHGHYWKVNPPPPPSLSSASSSPRSPPHPTHGSGTGPAIPVSYRGARQYEAHNDHQPREQPSHKRG